MTEQTRRFFKNALALAGAAVLMRTVGVAYNATLSAHIGAEGMGLFSLISSLQGFAITFATSGVSLAVTRLVSECMGSGEPASARAALRRATLYALLFSGVAFAVLFFGAPLLGAGLLGDGRTVSSLRILAFALPPMALCSVFNGYFTAVGRMVGPSGVQVAEQAVRIVLTLYLLPRLLPYGVEYACASVVAGATLAQLLSFALLLFLYLIDRRRLHGTAGGTAGLTARLCHIALPVACSSYVRSGLLTLEHLLIPRALVWGGRRTPEEALGTYGILSAMALPVVMFPMGTLASFSSLLIPHYAAAKARGEEGRIRALAARTLHLATVGAVLCATFLFVFSRDLGLSIYRSETAGEYIRLLAPVLPLMFLDHITDCALKGLGEQVYTMWVNIADSAMSCLLVVLLLPSRGAVGYILVIVIAEAVNLTLSVGRLVRVTTVRYLPLRSAVLPALCAAASCWLVRRLFHLDAYVVTVPYLLLEGVFALCAFLVLYLPLSRLLPRGRLTTREGSAILHSK